MKTFHSSKVERKIALGVWKTFLQKSQLEARISECLVRCLLFQPSFYFQEIFWQAYFYVK